jgi:branched-subunit amino acid aminotransferase/4-amino-4-deoxychorismate lyase
MSPGFNRSGPCLIVLAEWKAPVYERSGIRLITSAVRRNAPACLDSKIHHNNLINNILAKIQANHAGVDDALMLDVHGFVAETNATNVFLVKRSELVTPHADSCLPGITRAKVLAIAREAAIPTVERNVTLAEVWTADEMFTSGTMGELSPVLEVDGRAIGDGGIGPLTRRLQALYAEHTATEGTPLPEWD